MLRQRMLFQKYQQDQHGQADPALYQSQERL